jgi:hypothetical protein
MECKFLLRFSIWKTCFTFLFSYSAVQPNLHSAYAKSPAPIEALHGSVLDSLQVVASDLKENSDSDQDNLDRLAVIGRVLPMFSLDELRYLWEDVKNQDAVIV